MKEHKYHCLDCLYYRHNFWVDRIMYRHYCLEINKPLFDNNLYIIKQIGCLICSELQKESQNYPDLKKFVLWREK